jgi:hypothetical protein
LVDLIKVAFEKKGKVQLKRAGRREI